MKNEKKVSKSKKTKTDGKSQKLSKFSVFFAILILVVVVCLAIGTTWIMQTIKYKEYTDQMYLYKYNELYSNKKATAFTKVTNLDMYKVLLGSLNDTLTVDKIALVDKTENMTDDDVWFETAKVMNLRLRVEESDRMKRATTLDAVITAMRIVEGCLNVNVEEAKLNMSKEKLAKLSDTDSKYIAKAVTLGILDNDDSSLKKDKMIKGELNKLVIEVANRFATVYYKDKVLTEDGKLVNNEVSIVMDKEKLPTNAQEFPYVVDNITKSEYEIPVKVENKKDFKNAKEVFRTMGDLYGQIDNTISNYFDQILNVDYSTIQMMRFLTYVNTSSIYKLDLDDVEPYVDYIKEHKIKLKGEAKVMLPIMYYSGEDYYVRTKLTFEVLSSDTNKDLLYRDLGNNVEYNGKEFTMYVDVPMSMTLNSRTLLVNMRCLAKDMVKDNANIKVPKVEGGLIYEKTK